MSNPDTATTPVIGAISGQLKGRIRSKPYVIAFTDEQTIFARTTNALRKAEIAKARTAAKSGGGGFFSQVGAQMGAAQTMHERYLEMPVADILAEHEHNHAVANRAVHSVQLSKPVVIADNEEGEFYEKPPVLRLKTAGRNYKIRLDDHMNYEETKDLLERVYGVAIR
jgi:hypothetical protein